MSLNTLRHVNTTTYVPAKLAVAVVEGNAAVEDPPVGAIRALEAVVHLENLAPLKTTEIGLQASLKVILVDSISPLVPDFLLHAPAPKQQPPIIEVVTLRGSVGTPNHDRRLFN
ncbi:MAG TPA: hypothetical protein VKX49_01355 [Bryobacteraceae bacterium]|nr:hypothetical protein [Bryobacteraceae bacterium]